MSYSQPRVVVIGAGMAGLSSAVHLVEKGFNDVTILEAADRIGGRIHTVPFGDGPFPVELGANWIHGATLENSVFELAETIGVLNPYRLNNRNSCRFMREDGTEIERHTVKEAVHAFRRMDSKIRSIIPQKIKQQWAKPDDKPTSIQSVLDMLMEQEMSELIRRFPNNQGAIADIKRVFNALKIHLAFHEADELHKVSWETDVEDIPGGDIHIPKGYVQILQYLINRLPKHCLRLQSEVVNITSSEYTGTLEISVRNGAKFVADHVIVTCSLGYLKMHLDTLFQPPLPVNKVKAIASIGFGRVNKIYLEFDRPVTSPSYQSVGFAWDHTTIGVDKTEWYRMIFGFDQVFTRDNTLLGWIVGDAAEHMENLSNQEIGEICVGLLRKFLCDDTIPYPKRVLVSRWCSNPYVLGSYSYLTPALNPGDQNVLAQPVSSSTGEPRILFAGEATVLDFYACTHGARSSGIREAQRLVDLYTNRKIPSKM